MRHDPRDPISDAEADRRHDAAMDAPRFSDECGNCGFQFTKTEPPALFDEVAIYGDGDEVFTGARCAACVLADDVTKRAEGLLDACVGPVSRGYVGPRSRERIAVAAKSLRDLLVDLASAKTRLAAAKSRDVVTTTVGRGILGPESTSPLPGDVVHAGINAAGGFAKCGDDFRRHAAPSEFRTIVGSLDGVTCAKCREIVEDEEADLAEDRRDAFDADEKPFPPRVSLDAYVEGDGFTRPEDEDAAEREAADAAGDVFDDLTTPSERRAAWGNR